MEDIRARNGFKGRFIVLDGPDGCGKSSQARMLMDWVQSQGVAAVGFRDPGATVIGEKIREILLSPAHEAMTTPAEVLLYMAARVQLWTGLLLREASVKERASAYWTRLNAICMLTCRVLTV